MPGAKSTSELFSDGETTFICAPMVRYSKLPFRQLIRQWGCQLAFTPMIIAESFAQSERARRVEFSTDAADRPLIVQFAAKDAETLVDAAQHVVDQCDGIDLNCGCPQRWALRDNIGAALIETPELLADMVAHARRCLPADVNLSIKIRLRSSVEETVELCRRAEAAGVSFVTVHGRTVDERPRDSANWEAIRHVKLSLGVPVVANGDCTSLSDAERFASQTGADGIMAARSLLTNPALFSGYDTTPFQLIRQWLDPVTQCQDLHMPFRIFRNHTQWMLEHRLVKRQRIILNQLDNSQAILRFLTECFPDEIPFPMDNVKPVVDPEVC